MVLTFPNILDERKELVDCVKSLYSMGLTTSVSGNHSIRKGSCMWITPSGVPRYKIRQADIVKVNLRTGRSNGRFEPSIEHEMHRSIYKIRPEVNAIVHTHSPFTIGVSISSRFRHVIEEARTVVGEPSIIPNRPSGSAELAARVSDQFQRGARVVIIKNHGVVSGGTNIYHARAMIESLEEWAKIMTIEKIFRGSCTTRPQEFA